MAKLKGHPAWPANVLEYISKNRVKVAFFGAEACEKFGFVNIAEITLFRNSADVTRLTLLRNIPKFKKAVKEALIVCDVPLLVSLVNEM